MLSDEDLRTCARAVALLGIDQPEDVRISLAWMLRNRIDTLQPDPEIPVSIEAACDEVLREALQDIDSATQLSLPDNEWQRIRATTRRVWRGCFADQTAGAVSCHRHDIAPLWARRRTPTALLGSYLFFR